MSNGVSRGGIGGLWRRLVAPRPVSPVVILALLAALGLQWRYIGTIPKAESTSPALWAIAALAVAGIAAFLFGRERSQGGRATPPALFLAVLSILLLQVALLFSAESIYLFLWKSFK